MKWSTLALPLAGCAGLQEGSSAVLSSPEVQQPVGDAIENLASGNWVGAIAALVAAGFGGYKAYNYHKKKVKVALETPVPEEK